MANLETGLTEGKVRREVLVTHRPGLHARPCVAIVTLVRSLQSQVRIGNGRREADAGEILDLLSMGVDGGSKVVLTAEGPDAEAAIDALARLFETNFGFDD